jgi:Ser/Thr protein kinase RdoA (MazF antagonist)
MSDPPGGPLIRGGGRSRGGRREAELRAAREAASRFFPLGDKVGVRPYGRGHINSTFAVSRDQAGTGVRYLLQRVNTSVFRDPGLLMDNVARVTAHLRHKLEERGAGSISRRVITLLRAEDGRPFWIDGSGGFWRAMLLIEGVRSSGIAENPEEALALGRAVGRFQADLADLPGPRLGETIPRFHDAAFRLAAFERAVAEDRAGRAASVRREIDYFAARREGLDRLAAGLASGELAERTTHNDAKMDNLLVDRRTGEALCLVDLDTVMPGAAAYDFGDLARTAAASTVEDDPEQGRMALVMPMLAALARGYAEGCGSAFLTRAEIGSLAPGARIITLVQGLRFMTDHLEGDVYYRIARPSHNLDRCRTQMALASSMEEKVGEMGETIEAAFARAL